VGATLFDRALEVLRPGVKESEVAAEMEYAARRAGAEEMSFPTIIASGARSALPHGRATEASHHARRIRGLRFRCYTRWFIVSDRTRTVWVGAASKDGRHAYESVREAQQAAICRRATWDLASGKSMRRRARYCARLGLGRYLRTPPGMAWVWRSTKRPGLRLDKRSPEARHGSSRLSREYTSPENGA